MPKYAEGFVFVVPKKNIAAYRKIARKAGKVWMEHGALEYCECQGDDLTHQGVAMFPRLVKLKKGETVWFSWILYKSKRERDRVLKKVLTDPRLAGMVDPKKMPFDMKRMSYGGFRVEVGLHD